MLSRAIAVSATLALLAAAPSSAQSPSDAELVRAAAFDYLDAFYQGDTARIVRSVSPDVVKYGYWIPRDADAYEGEAMSYQEMLDYARHVKESGRHVSPEAPHEVEILDIADQTAAVKVTAWWGIDYLHLARVDGRWQILHVLWQSKPKNG